MCLVIQDHIILNILSYYFSIPNQQFDNQFQKELDLLVDLHGSRQKMVSRYL